MFISKDKGLFDKYGIDADLNYVTVSPSIPPSLVAGSLQVGGMTTPDLLHALDGGLDLVIIAGANTNPGKLAKEPSGTGAFARTGIDIKDPKDFVGKRVGLPGIGTTADIAFRQWLRNHGVDPKTVGFVEIPLPQGSDALRTGLVDAVVSVPPFATRIVNDKTGYLAADYSRGLDPYLAGVYVATRDWAEQHKPVVDAFRKAIGEAIALQSADPDGARASVAKWLKLPPQAQAGLVLSDLTLDVTAADLKFWVDAMIDQGLIKSSPNLNNAIFQ